MARILCVWQSLRNICLTPLRLSGNRKAGAMHKLRIRFLMHVHGMTEAQANSIAALIWGAA